MEATRIAETASLVGDPGRATMLGMLLDGRAHTAGELAASVGVSASTASGHLAKLLSGGLVAVESQGRHRYYRLASVEVARMLEGIMTVTVEASPRSRATLRVPAELREARTCYDHLAGRLGVAIAEALVADEAVSPTDGVCAITSQGERVLSGLEIDLGQVGRRGRRPLCRPCLDWSERRPHLAGILGAAILERTLALGWIKRSASSRAIIVTRAGAPELIAYFGFNAALPR